jgi:hypothetical protein
MKRYPAWQALFRSFYHTDFYRDTASNWKGLGFFYLFLLAAFSSLIWALIAFFFVAQLCDKHLLPIADRFPTVTAQNDKYSIDKPSPYFIEDDLLGTVFTFDTSGSTKALDHPGVLVTDEAVINSQQRSGTNELKQTVAMQASGSKGTFGKNDARNMVLALRNFGPMLVFVICLFWLTLFNFFQALIYGSLGLISNSLLKTRLTYSQLVRLAALAMTPPIVLNWLIKPIFTMPFGMEQGISFILSMVYLFVGVRACKTLLWSQDGPFGQESPVPESAAPSTFQSFQPPANQATQPEQTLPSPDAPEQPPTS